MKPLTRTLLLAFCLLCAGTAFAQSHTLTYDKKAKPVDSVVDIGGVPHVIVKIPVRDFVSGDRYIIIYASPLSGGVFTAATITAVHNENAFQSTIEIDSYPAQVNVSDALSYSVTSASLGSNTFTVTGFASASVQIDIGHTLVTLTDTFIAKDKNTDLPPITEADIGPTANAVPAAQWARYVDRLELIKPLDRWIDFIRVVAL